MPETQDTLNQLAEEVKRRYGAFAAHVGRRVTDCHPCEEARLIAVKTWAGLDSKRFDALHAVACPVGRELLEGWWAALEALRFAYRDARRPTVVVP